MTSNMDLKFNLQDVVAVEFGVGRDEGKDEVFVLVPVDRNVQLTLREMAANTWEKLRDTLEAPRKYEPSEKYESAEYVYVYLEDKLADTMRNLHTAENLPMDAGILQDPSSVFCYFARLVDRAGNRLTAVRRATQFKGILKSRLVRLLTDTLTLVHEPMFKLDTEFDFLIDAELIHILRPSGFEFVGKLQKALLDAVPRMIQDIQRDMPFVDFVTIEQYASSHTRAARYLASIRGQKENRNIDIYALKRLCTETGVQIQDVDGRIAVASGYEMAFLEVLDRRRYVLELIEGSPERFKATGRIRI